MASPEPPPASAAPRATRAHAPILLIDDQRFVGLALARLLDGEPGFELHCCERGSEAEAAADRVRPALILQDLVMPDVDGLALVRAFRTRTSTARTPVIVLSGNDDEGTRARALAAGAHDYLVKLPTKDVLLACLDRHLSAARARAGAAAPAEAHDAGDGEPLDTEFLAAYRDEGADDPDGTLRELLDVFFRDAERLMDDLRRAAAAGFGAAVPRRRARAQGVRARGGSPGARGRVRPDRNRDARRRRRRGAARGGARARQERGGSCSEAAMRNLKVWQKLALMGVIFLIPFALVTMKMVSAIDTLGVDFAAQELRGLEFTRPALTLVKDLQQHRDVASIVLNGEAGYRGRLDGVRADVEKDLAAIDELDKRLGTRAADDRPLEGDADRLHASCCRSRPDSSADESFARHSRLIADVIALVGEVGRASNLTLDPDAGRAHLVTVLVASGPELGELLARARGVGAGMAASQARRADQIDQLNRQSILMESVGAKLDAAMAAALDLTPGLKAQLEASATASSDAVIDAQGEIVKLTGRAVRTGSAQTTTADAYFASMSRGIEAIDGLEHKLAGSLQTLLTARVASLQQDVRETLAWALVGLLVVSLFGIYVMRDVTVTLRDVVIVANHIAAGDLSVRVQARERRDELGVLGRSFDQMVASFKDMVAAAERIAAGDLAVTVTPRSERDALGHALSNMAGRLSGLLSDVHRSGIQVNTSVNEIAASAREQEATATEVAAATTEIAATSREIAATSQELVRTMSEVFSAAEESAALAGQGQAGLTRMEATMRQVMDAVGLDQRQAGRDQREGRQHQPGGDHHHQGGRPDEPAVDQRGDRGGEGRRVRPRLRGGGPRDPPPGRPDGGGDLDIERMVKEMQSAVSAGVMEMDKFTEEVRRGMHEIEQVERPAHADHPPGAGARAARARRSATACRPRPPAPARSPRRWRS